MRLLYKLTLTLALLACLLVTPGCTNQSEAEAPPPPCPSLTCRVVIPPCQPPALLGMGMPRDAGSQLGFLPYVAMWLPATVSWYSAQAYPSGQSSIQLLPSQPRPLMRIEYARYFPRPYNTYAVHAVIAFDETTQALGLTTNITIPGQTVVIKSTALEDINGHTATFFELQGSTGNNETTVIGVEWQSGTLWVRVTAVASGRYLPISSVDGDDIVAWEGTSKDELLRVARSASSYTGCDRNISGAS